MTPDQHVTVPWLTEVAPDELRRIVDALYRVHRFLSAITDLDTLLESIMEESKQVANAEACSLMLYDPEADELFFHVALGESGDQQALKREVRLRRGQGIAGAAAQTRESINVEDVRTDPRFFRDADVRSRFETRSLLAVPLIDRNELVGVIEVLNKTGGGSFTETDLRVMEIFSTLTATAIANARLIEENLRAARLAALGQAVAGMSHYTKNILAGMTSSIDLIDQGIERDNFDFLRKSWPVFKRCTERIAHFVEDMLAYSKPRKPVRRPLKIASVVQDAAETFQGLMVVKRVALDIDTGRVAGEVCLDARGIYRCLLNLITNAADAVPREGGRIAVRVWTGDDGCLFIEVSDNGPGVPDDLRGRIFEPFFSTKGSEGTGLGLAVTRKIVREHGGDMQVATGPEGGACFRIAIPRGEPTEG